MHICFITHEYPKANYPHGGIGTFIQTFARALVKEGHKVSIVGVNQYDFIDEVYNDEGVDVYRLKLKKIKWLTWFFNFKSLNKKIKELHIANSIDIVETPELGLAFIKKISGIKYVIRLHGGHHFFAESEERGIDIWKGFQEKRAFKKADGFIAVSDYVKSHTSKYLSYHNKPNAKINYPINLDRFQPKPEIKVDDNKLLFAGTVCEKKGIRQLIIAMKKVLEVYPETILEIYGRDWFFKDGRSYIQYLKDYVIPQLGEYKNHIVFKGVVSLEELSEQYASARVCVFPSLMETQGLVAPEAMAMEKVVLFTELGPGPETINHQETGLLCNPYNIDSISSNILWVLNNSEICIEIAKNGRKYVESTFNLNTIVDKNIAFYKSLG